MRLSENIYTGTWCNSRHFMCVCALKVTMLFQSGGIKNRMDLWSFSFLTYHMPPGLKSSTTIRIFVLEVQNNNAGCNLGFAHTQMHFIFKRKVVFNWSDFAFGFLNYRWLMSTFTDFTHFLFYLFTFPQVVASANSGGVRKTFKTTAKTAAPPRRCKLRDIICVCFRLLFYDWYENRPNFSSFSCCCCFLLSISLLRIFYIPQPALPFSTLTGKRYYLARYWPY